VTEVRPAGGPDEVQAAFAVRRAVFMEEQGVTEDEEFDGLDDAARQLVAVEDGRVVATCRLLPGDDGAMKFQRLAVAPEARRRGIARRLLAEAEAQARAGGYRTMVLDAQTGALPLYTAAGYRGVGDVFWDARIEHQRMVKALADA
jgi:predicted GNAT family N-acyltransferase